MNTQTLDQFEVLSTEVLANVEGGEMLYANPDGVGYKQPGIDWGGLACNALNSINGFTMVCP